LQQQLAHSNGHVMHDSNSERGNSPHGSEHSSRYSGPGIGQVNGMNGLNAGMRYPSPTAMQNPLPMLSGYRNDNSFDNSMMQQNISRAPVGQTPDASAARKAFDCSTCGKDFARRSDLARHGKPCRPCLKWFTFKLISIYRANTQWYTTSRLRLPRLWQAVHSTIRLDCPCKSTHGREAPYV